MSTSMNDKRRELLKIAAATGLAAGLAPSALAQAKGRAIKLGYVSPQTGPLAPFGEADKFVLGGVNKVLKAGVTVAGKTHPVEVIVKDSQSSPNRAGEVARELIQKNRIDLMLVASTPETTNPVSDQCELAGVPCISTVAPWQP